MKLMAQSSNTISISFTQGEKLRHLGIWFLVWGFMLLTALEVDWPLGFSVATQTPYLLWFMVVFYGLLYWACPFWHQNKKRFVINTLLGLTLFSVGYVLLDLHVPEYVPDGYLQPVYPLWSHIMDAILFFVFIEVVVLGVYFQKYNLEKIRINSQKEIDLANKKEQIIRQELDFYKSEFNTHITFNTLSHIYSKVMEDSELASPILLLSDILRYNLKVQPHQEVSLEQEINYLKTFIEIYQVLYPKLQVNLSVEGESRNVKILPRILISFVENAFKHGDKKNPCNPIQITLTIGEQIHFTVSNKKRPTSPFLSTKLTSTKVGIKNVRKTLDAFYPNQYQLEITEDQKRYKVYLCIDNQHESFAETNTIIAQSI